MKKSNKFLLALMVIFAFAVVLVACGNDNDGNDSGNDPVVEVDPGGETDPTEDETDPSGEEPAEIVEQGGIPAHIQAMMVNAIPPSDDMIEGGVLRFARIQPDPFEGILHSMWNGAATDANIVEFFHNNGTTTDDDFLLELGDDSRGYLIPVISDDFLTITFTIRDGVYWHDGEPLTAEDFLFTYEVLASAEYAASGGVRFGQQNERSIVGIMDFHEGNADYIAGIEVIADNEFSITFDSIVPIRNTVFMMPLPAHIFRDIPIEDMSNSPYIRTASAIGVGPFMVDSIVPGESVNFVANENYWQGAPVLDGIEFSIVPGTLIGEAMAAGTIDVAHTFQESQFPYFSNANNFSFLADPAFVFNYVGFRLGRYVLTDPDDVAAGGFSEINPDATMANLDLRLAMWKAIDGNLVAANLFNDIRWDGTALIPPTFASFHNADLVRPPHDMEAANAMLDAAGFEMGADGFRLNPDGSELTINFFSAASGGDPVAEGMNQYFLAQWRALGLNVVDNFDLDFPTFHEQFDTDVDNDDIDVFIGAWSFGSNPSPYGLFGRTAGFNYTRYVSDRMDDLLARIDSEEAVMDFDYRVEAFLDWQEYMVENASMFPFLYRFAFVPVNNRVVNYRIHGIHTPVDGWHLVGLTSDTPYVNTNN